MQENIYAARLAVDLDALMTEEAAKSELPAVLDVVALLTDARTQGLARGSLERPWN
jgi:hypothetical protein